MGNNKTSQKKIEANRKNARKSTGPKSAEGKRRVSQNAVKYGILAKEVVIKAGDGQESEEEFDALYTELWEEFNPCGPVEEKLVERIAICYWRLRRALRAEVGEIRKDLDLTLFHSLIDRYDPVRFWEARDPDEDSGQFHRVSKTLDDLIKYRKKEAGEVKKSFDDGVKIVDFFIEYLAAHEVPVDKIPDLEDVVDELDQLADQTKERLDERIDEYAEDLRDFKDLIKDKLALELESKFFSRSLPSKEAVEKILRYETAIERQLYKAIHELERLQRRRQGEIVPPPINVDVSSST